MKKEQKLKLQSSGSIEQPEELEEKNQAPAVRPEEDRAADLFKQILDATEIDSLLQDSFVENNFVVQSEDGQSLWLLSLTTKSFKRIPNNSEITMMDRIDDAISHCLINSDLYEVKNKLIKDIGWN